MDLYEAGPFNSLFRRCVQGCSKVTPRCPTCAANEVCSLVPPTCYACQSTICVAASSVTTTISTNTKSSSTTNIPAIAGGVIGGVLVIAAATYLVWRFCIKTKRQQYEQDDWIEELDDSVPAEKDATLGRDPRASTHTVASIASTVLTRASNIIQIAYIPGVTNRSAPSTPGVLVPPVPPIPIALSSASTTPRYEQEHFFMPGDLRDSTYSGISERTSYARNSVASTIYGKNAVVSPIPAQTVIRGKAAVVSVKPSGANTPGDLTPPVPSVDYGRFGVSGLPSPAFSVGSTFLNSASAATQMKPQVVRVSSGRKKSPAQSSASEDELSARQSLLGRNSNAITVIDDTPAVEQGPFSDPPDGRHQSSTSLSAVIEEATKRAHGAVPAGPELHRDNTPFGDEHELNE